MFAIVDRDFDAVNGVDVGSSDVAVTDDHDAEMMLLRSAALEKLLVEFALSEDIDHLRTTLLEAGRPLGYLRWLSLKQNLRLDFDDLLFKDFVDPDTLTTDPNLCIAAIVRNTRGCTLSPEGLLPQLDKLMAGRHDLWQVCCGHDLVAILAIRIERCSGRSIHPAIVARSVRLAFEFAHFQVTKLFAWIQEWETRNPEWRVLR